MKSMSTFTAETQRPQRLRREEERRGDKEIGRLGDKEKSGQGDRLSPCPP